MVSMSMRPRFLMLAVLLLATFFCSTWSAYASLDAAKKSAEIWSKAQLLEINKQHSDMLNQAHDTMSALSVTYPSVKVDKRVFTAQTENSILPIKHKFPISHVLVKETKAERTSISLALNLLKKSLPQKKSNRSEPATLNNVQALQNIALQFYTELNKAKASTIVAKANYMSEISRVQLIVHALNAYVQHGTMDNVFDDLCYTLTNLLKLLKMEYTAVFHSIRQEALLLEDTKYYDFLYQTIYDAALTQVLNSSAQPYPQSIFSTLVHQASLEVALLELDGHLINGSSTSLLSADDLRQSLDRMLQAWTARTLESLNEHYIARIEMLSNAGETGELCYELIVMQTKCEYMLLTDHYHLAKDAGCINSRLPEKLKYDILEKLSVLRSCHTALHARVQPFIQIATNMSFDVAVARYMKARLEAAVSNSQQSETHTTVQTPFGATVSQISVLNWFYLQGLVNDGYIKNSKTNTVGDAATGSTNIVQAEAAACAVANKYVAKLHQLFKFLYPLDLDAKLMPLGTEWTRTMANFGEKVSMWSKLEAGATQQ